MRAVLLKLLNSTKALPDSDKISGKSQEERDVRKEY
jgi:hypothetical protein